MIRTMIRQLIPVLPALAVIFPGGTALAAAHGSLAARCLSALRAGAAAPCVWYGTVTISYGSSYDAWALNKQGNRAFRVHFETACRVTATFAANGQVHADPSGMKLFDSSGVVEATGATISYFTPGGQPAGMLSYTPIVATNGAGTVKTWPTTFQGEPSTRVQLPRFSFKALGTFNGNPIPAKNRDQQAFNLYCGFDAVIPNHYGYAREDNGARARVIYATTPQPQPLVYNGGAFPDELWSYAQSYLPRGVTLNQKQMKGQTLGYGMVQLSVQRKTACYP